MKDIAFANLMLLAQNPYPGRGIVVGLDESGTHFVQAYWIMGRSENSRNRIFSFEDDRLYTEAADLAKVENPRLIIYNAMARCGFVYIVSNGDQTDTISEVLRRGLTFNNAMYRRIYEPDTPNFTPRISAVCSIHGGLPAEIAILKKSEWGDDCIRSFHRYDGLPTGFGYCITTYSGDGNPLPAFRGEPYPLPLAGNISAVATRLWGNLNEANRVSLAVRFIDRVTGESKFTIINKYSKVTSRVSS